MAYRCYILGFICISECEGDVACNEWLDLKSFVLDLAVWNPFSYNVIRVFSKRKRKSRNLQKKKLLDSVKIKGKLKCGASLTSVYVNNLACYYAAGWLCEFFIVDVTVV